MAVSTYRPVTKDHRVCSGLSLMNGAGTSGRLLLSRVHTWLSDNLELGQGKLFSDILPYNLYRHIASHFFVATANYVAQ